MALRFLSLMLIFAQLGACVCVCSAANLPARQTDRKACCGGEDRTPADPAGGHNRACRHCHPAALEASRPQQPPAALPVAPVRFHDDVSDVAAVIIDFRSNCPDFALVSRSSSLLQQHCALTT